MSPLYKPSFQDRGDGVFWIDHLTLADAEIDALANARNLTLWNVKVPGDFFERLPGLRSLDLRGGSGKNIDPVAGAHGLVNLTVNQVRGITSVDAIVELRDLESLSLYGLAHLERLPSLAPLTKLRMVQLGQMRSFRDLSPVAEAPALEDLRFVRKLGIDADSMKPLLGHPTLKVFDWFWEDVAASQALPVLAVLGLPKPKSW
jgi:hypothetical protein